MVSLVHRWARGLALAHKHEGDKITDASIEVSMEWVLTHAESDITPTERRVSTR